MPRCIELMSTHGGSVVVPKMHPGDNGSEFIAEKKRKFKVAG